MKTQTILRAGILALLTVTSAHADTFGSGGNAFTIDFVTIGNPGNADDAGAGGGIYSTPYGGVAYDFNMGVTEVSQDTWILFPWDTEPQFSVPLAKRAAVA